MLLAVREIPVGSWEHRMMQLEALLAHGIGAANVDSADIVFLAIGFIGAGIALAGLIAMFFAGKKHE